MVAGEVRNLAKRASDSAGEIKKLINEAMDNMAVSTKLVEKTASASEEIAGQAQELLGMVK